MGEYPRTASNLRDRVQMEYEVWRVSDNPKGVQLVTSTRVPKANCTRFVESKSWVHLVRDMALPRAIESRWITFSTADLRFSCVRGRLLSLLDYYIAETIL